MREGLVVSVSPFAGHALHLAGHMPALVEAVNANKFGRAMRIRQHMSKHRKMLKQARGD